jgi:hypothetical protein
VGTSAATPTVNGGPFDARECYYGQATGMPKMNYSRAISDAFMKDLLSGTLARVLARVKEDDTLMLALRGNYINIYYRGGNLVRITAPPESHPDLQRVYRVAFDANYCRGFSPLSVDIPPTVSSDEDAALLLSAIPQLKFAMDRFFSRHQKPEREFQQLVARENNRSSISNETEYFIVDIELAGALPGARFDMLAVRWLSRERARPAVCVPALIEMKYGNDALAGEAGLMAHLKDAYALRTDQANWENLLAGIEGHLKQLDTLGLLDFHRSAAVPDLLLRKESTPELIFLLANYNPRSRKILDILPDFKAAIEEHEAQQGGQKLFDIRFFQTSFAGYGMHRAGMLNTSDFEALVQRLHND